ncbi:hypothetical protein B0H12DRAFT_1261413 [Mycena haematopus]|nr:hypothetical protein B0H12DRAFT_1261413 [Mycena haematopus]
MAKDKKPKVMFQPYNAAEVPDIMPFPQIAVVANTKGEELAVPKLNEYQRSWILDVGVRDLDLPSLVGKAATAVYDKVKDDAFKAQAFQHTTAPTDRDEESHLPALIAKWKRNNPLKKSKAEDSADSDREEDEGAREGLLRGYTKAGWRRVIQKVISNKCGAEKRKPKPTPKKQDTEDTISETPAAAAPAAPPCSRSSLAKEDHAVWEAAAAAEDGVDWVERQKLVASGFQHMVKTLNTSRKFRPFVATMLIGWLSEEGRVQFEWVEAVPEGIHMPQSFEKQYAQVVRDSTNGMYTWAEKPLQDYLAARKNSAKGTSAVFPVSTDALEDMSPKAIKETVTKYLTESYHITEATFGTQEIPWAAVSTQPGEYYTEEENGGHSGLGRM